MFSSDSNSLFDGLSITRSTSAPPVSGHIGGLGLSLDPGDEWSSYLQHNPHNLNPRLPLASEHSPPRHSQAPQSLTQDSRPHLFQPQPRQHSRPHPGAIGTPVIPSPSPTSSLFDDRPKSVVDLIQEDFPRTPSPIYPAPQQSSHHQHSSAAFGNDFGSVDTLANAVSGIHLREAPTHPPHQPTTAPYDHGYVNDYPPPPVYDHMQYPNGAPPSNQHPQMAGRGEYVLVPVPGNPGYFYQQPADMSGHPTRVIYPNSQDPYMGAPQMYGTMMPPHHAHDPQPQRNGRGGGGGRRRENGKGRRGSGSRANGSLPSLLNELKHGNKKQWELSSVKGHVVEFCKDQHGSRFIQQKLETATSDEKQFVFSEVLPQAQLLMTDVFGNYVIQKFFDFGLDEHRDLLTNVICGRVVRLSMQMYGCRVIQKSLETMPIERLVPLIDEFYEHVLECVHDQNGNHVIQKCIERLARDKLFVKLEFIVDAFRGRSLPLASHPYGCRVIQRLLEHCNSEQKNSILEELNGSIRNLVEDQYGNYVVQHMIQFGRVEDREAVIDTIRGNLYGFAMHKFASNVVEKCLQYGSQESKQFIIDEIINVDGTSSCSLLAMVRDQYANYVVQKVIDLATQKQLSQIIDCLRPSITIVKKCTYGKHILTRLERATGEKF